MDVVIVCHVEHGCATDHSVIFDKKQRQGAVDGVKNAILISAKHDAAISFMMMPEVLEDFAGFDFMDHEVGLHIHPDDLLLMNEGLGGFHRPLREYDFQDQKRMISTGKQLVIESLGVVPSTFVAGKWSVGNETLKALAELGFTHDASGCPQFFSESCDWRKLPRICMPYRPSGRDYQTPGGMRITEVPVSKELTGENLGPESKAGLRFLKAALHEYADLGVPLLHVAFHSPAMTSLHYRKTFSQLLEWVSDLGGSYRPLSMILPMKQEIPPNAKRLSRYLMNADVNALSFILIRMMSSPRNALKRLRWQVASESHVPEYLDRERER